MNDRKISSVALILIVLGFGFWVLSYWVPQIARIHALGIRVVFLVLALAVFAAGLEYVTTRRFHAWRLGRQFSWKKVLVIVTLVFALAAITQALPARHANIVSLVVIIVVIAIAITRNVKQLGRHG